MIAQRLPEIALAGMGEAEQLGLGPAAKGGPQDGGQRQVILGRVKEGQKRGKVLDRQFAPQLKPVGPGDRQAKRFAGADDLVKQRPSGVARGSGNRR